MKDTETRIRELRCVSQHFKEEHISDAGFAVFQAGLIAFGSSASDQQLMRCFAEHGAGNTDELIAGVTMAPSVLQAVLSAIKAVEAELHSTFAVAAGGEE